MNATCGCCTGTEIVVPLSEVNAPGRSELVYRAGTYATFFETMLARLSRVPGLRTRDPADPSIALLDAWANVADVLTFYQERIANEGFLATARERRSLLELAKLIGYRARPGVAASVRLAFTVAKDFRGAIPRGTRAQSIPGAGESPQFFETSVALEARDTWNVLAPRITRPQLITPLGFEDPDMRSLTDADLIDTVYLDGITTNLKPGDGLFFVFGNGLLEQALRIVRSVDIQPEQQRTEVTLALNAFMVTRDLAVGLLTQFREKAKWLFPGSTIAPHVRDILDNLIANWDHAPKLTERTALLHGASLLRGALAQVAAQLAVAEARGFTRTSAFLRQLVYVLELLYTLAGFIFPGNTNPTPKYKAVQEPLIGSSLARLDAIVRTLAERASLQPANSLQLDRSVRQSFTPQSDLAARLIAKLKPAAAGSLYRAWTGIVTPKNRGQVLAARVKASLFASRFVGAAIVSRKPPPGPDGQRFETTDTSFTPPTIATAWISIATFAPPPPPAPNTVGPSKPAVPFPLGWLALDGPYEHIAIGSWVAVDQPVLPVGGAVGRHTSFHAVVDNKLVAMDTRAGFSANVTVLALDPPWLTNKAALIDELVLRTTAVYAQSEVLGLAEEPLDTDVGGDRIDLADVYDGLEPGRWIIVSGTRTDIPGTVGVAASEPAMIAAVSQGTEAPFSAPFPFHDPPFETIRYVTAPDVNGDRLVVGRLTATAFEMLRLTEPPKVGQAPLPEFVNQRYRDQVQLEVGIYADAYIPSHYERMGLFPTFAGMLIDPDSKVPYTVGTIGAAFAAGLFAWRIAEERLHTTLTLASKLAYTYDRSTVTIYGNVVDATHGQTTGEVLGDGDAARAFQTFALGQSPLTYVSAPTPSGTASTLTVRVNELERHEAPDLASARPSQRVYVTQQDDAQKTTVTFGDGVHGARLPTGTANVKAVYRYGLGKAGNVAGGKISQLATHPLGAQGVVNPLPATGGADPDRIDQIRANAPLAVTAFDRLVSVRDYADFARTYAGIGKAVAARMSDGRKQVVHLTVAGGGDIPIDLNSDLYRNLVASLRAFGDPHQPVAVDVRRVKLLVMSAAVALQPDYLWESVAPKVRAAVLALFDFDARELGQTAFLSEAVRAAQNVEGVAYVNVTVFAGVAENITAAQLAALGTTLGLNQFVLAETARIDPDAAAGSAQRFVPAELVFMTPDIPDTLILSEAGT